MTETIFSWPGLGRVVVTAISNRDYALVQGCLLSIGLTYVLANLLTDLESPQCDRRRRNGHPLQTRNNGLLSRQKIGPHSASKFPKYVEPEWIPEMSSSLSLTRSIVTQCLLSPPLRRRHLLRPGIQFSDDRFD